MFADCIKSSVHPATWVVIGFGRDAAGNEVFAHRGTAFAIDAKGHLLTCWHVTYMDKDCQVECEKFGVFQPELALAVKHSAQLVAKDKDRDVAVLKINGDVRTRPVRLYGGTPSFGKSCCSFGHPLSVTDATTQTMRIFTRAAGGIVSMHYGGAIYPGARDVALYELDFFTHGGSSGGPVFLTNGDVFAFVRASLLLDDGSGKQTRSNLSVAVDIHEAVEFLKPLNIHPQIHGGARR